MSSHLAMNRVGCVRAVGSRRRVAVALALAAGSLGWGCGARGQTWTGAGATNNWSAAANWSGGAPANNGTANVTFSGSTRLTPNADVPWSINSLLFGAGGNFVLGGSQLTIGAGGVANNGGGVETVNNPVVLGASQTWSGSSQVTFGGPTLGLGGNTLIFAGGSGYVVNSAIAGTATTAIALSSGTLTLGGATSNSFSGGLYVNGGTLNLAKTSGSVAVPGALVIGDGVGAAASATVALQGTSEISPLSTVAVMSDGLLNLNGNAVALAGLSMSGGTVAIGSSLLQLYGNVTVTGSASGSLITAADDNNDLSLAGTRTFSVSAGTSPYDLDLNGVGIYNGALVKSGMGTMRIGGANTNSMSAVTLQQGTLAVAGGGAALGTALLTLAGGTLSPDTAGIDPGSLTVAGSVALTGDTVLGSDAAKDAIVFGGQVTVNGPRQLTIATPHASPTSAPIPAQFAGNIVASGAGNSLTFASSAPTEVALVGGADYGVINVGPNVTLYVAGANVAAAVTISPSATLAFANGTFSGELDNQGAISFAYSGLLTVGGSMLNEAPLTLASGEAILVGGTGLTNQAQITLSGGGVGGAATFANYGTVLGSGTIGGTGAFLNYGYLSSTTGNLTFNSVGGAVNYGNFVTTAGNGLQISAGTTLTNCGTLSLASQAVVAGQGALTNGAGGSLTGVGLITAPFYNAPGGSVFLTGGTLVIAVPFANAGLIQLGSPSATLGGGSITNSGTIQGLGVTSSAINNTAGFVEAIGGTLAVDGGLTNGVGGTIAVDGGAKVLVSPGLSANAGLISMTGGTFDNGGAPMINTGSIVGWGIFRTGGVGLVNVGTVTLTGGTTTVNGPVTNAATHSVTVQYNPAIFTGFFQNNGSLYVTGATATFAAGSGGAGSLGTPTPNAVVALAGGGSTVVSPGSTLRTDGVGQSSLSVLGTAGSYGRVTIPTQEPSGATPVTGRAVGQTVSILGTLNIASNGSGYLGDVDLADNDLIVTGMTEAAIRSYVASWYDGGKRDGLGLSSDLAGTGAGGAGPDALATLAVIANSNGEGGPLFSSFDGIAVTSSDVLVKYTYLGDTNLDGVVDGQDLANTLAGLSGGLTGWVNGDFTYSGSVTSADVTLLLNTLAHQTASFGDSGGSSGAVPEPSGLLWAAAVLPVLGRRRR